MTPLIVFSHLRWNFVFQRPQHLMTRLARHYRVFFFEEPVFSEGPARLEVSEPEPNVFVCRPLTPITEGGFSDEQLPTLQRLLEDLTSSRGLTSPVVWLYTPMALPMLQRLEPVRVIYDCMDFHAGFSSNTATALADEQRLIERSDLVVCSSQHLLDTIAPTARAACPAR